MKRTIIFYILYFISFIALFNFLLFSLAKIKKPYPLNTPLLSKLSSYKLNSDNYKVVFFGDSRTYTNINNEFFDSLNACNSFNLAHWSNWFPTQYAMFLDLLPNIPKGTTLIWSIGHQNFSQALDWQAIPTVYPINNYFTSYFEWGFDFKSIINNIQNYTALIVLQPRWAINWKKEFLKNNFLVPKFFKVNHDNDISEKKDLNINLDSNLTKFLVIKNKYLKKQKIKSVEKVLSNNKITSAVLKWSQGNYSRIEIDSNFFRTKQEEDLAQNPPSFKKTDDRYMKNFYEILEVLKKYEKKINIVVNFFEEAPYRYDSRNRNKYNNQIIKVKQVLKKNNFKYVSVEFSNFKNSDYFDYNHMNYKGSIKYTKKFSKILKENNAF